MKLDYNQIRILNGRKGRLERGSQEYRHHLTRALNKGLRKNTFDYRVFDLGWDVERAVNTPADPEKGKGNRRKDGSHT